MFILAGFPSSIDKRISSKITDKYGSHRVRFVHVPSSQHNDNELYNPKTTESLLRAAGEFIVRRNHGSTAQKKKPHPARIFLLYLPSKDSNALLERFDFFCCPIRLDKSITSIESRTSNDHNTSAWRHNESESLQIVDSYVRSILQEGTTNKERAIGDRVNFLATELGRNYRRSPLLLPPVNFAMRRPDNLAEHFIHARTNDLHWNQIQKAVTSTSTSKGATKNLQFIDSRDRLFPPASPREYHALTRELEEPAREEEIRHVLNQSYRLGIPIQEGFHYDVKKASEVPFQRERFECSRDGTVYVTGPYANIYPNDYIRAKKKITE